MKSTEDKGKETEKKFVVVNLEYSLGFYLHLLHKQYW